MSDLQQAQPTPDQDPSSAPSLFSTKANESGGIPVAAWAVAGLVVLLIVGGLVFFGRGKSLGAKNTIQPPAPYAATLPLTGLAMSESGNLSGGKYTYIDGHVRNTGTATVTAATIQVLFRNDEQMPPQIETLPLALIRTREPYIDTQPVNAAPIKPGDEREFRLIFETITGNWNQQMPQVDVIKVTTH